MTSLRKITNGFLVGTAVLALMSGMAPASAQTSESNSNSVSGSSSDSRSRSGAAAVSNSGSNRLNQNSNQQQGVNSTTNTGVTLNQTSNTPDTLKTTNSNSSSGGYNNVNTNWQGGHTTGDVTVRTTPTVYAPPVSGGNPCTLAVSGGVSVIGWGASAGGTFVDQDCAARQKIAMIHNAGYQLAARELMCNDKDTYIAFRGSGTPCAFRQQFEGAAPPMAAQPMVTQPVQITPVVAPPQPQAAKVYPKCDARRGIVDNCIS